MGKYCYNQKTLESSLSDFQSFVMNKVITTKQLTQVTQLIQKMSDELGGTDKTTSLISILVEEIAAQCSPYEEQVI